MNSFSLSQFSRHYCKRKGLGSFSLYFESDGEELIAHKIYFDPMTFLDFIRDVPNARLNLRDVPQIVAPIELRNAIIQATRDEVIRDDTANDKIQQFMAVHGDSLETNERLLYFAQGEKADRAEELADSLNEIFYGLAFDSKLRSYTRSALFDDIERAFNLYEEAAKDPKILQSPIVEENIDTEPEQYEFRIYSVGQANCSALIRYIDQDKKDYRVIVVFDFGRASRKRSANPSLQEMINKIDDRTAILISHFDNDHINNITNYTQKKTDRWLFPPCTNMRSQKANLLFYALLKCAQRKTSNGSISIYKTPFNLSPQIRITQYKGTRKGDPYQSTVCNSACLVASIRAEHVSILIPADALYEEFDASVQNESYTHILIPHHGCYYPLAACGAISKMLDSERVHGVVQCGTNRYGHANVEHLRRYRDVHYFYGTKFYQDRNTVAKKPRNAHGGYGDYYFISFNGVNCGYH